MFADTAVIKVISGNGGNGLVSFHREKYVAAGGPDGGDGGKGGDVIFKCDKRVATLADFRHKRTYKAENGGDGKAKRGSGKNGENLEVLVPIGTLIYDNETGKLIADLKNEGDTFLAARGGKGGWGNVHFATPTRQVPKFAKPGIKGIERELTLELKLIADVGLLGFPNVGKSTILSMATKATPKIANYHFTTLEPNLGVVDLKEAGSFVLADIPGIIEGAGEGVGLGHEFLRHIERTRLLLHVVDVSGIEGRNPISDFDIICEEMKTFNPELLNRKQIVVANKTDIITDETMYEEFLAEMSNRGYEVVKISAATNHGIKELMKKASYELEKIPIPQFAVEEDFLTEDVFSDDSFTITFDGEAYVCEGDKLLKVVNSTNFDDYESLQYFQKALRLMGVIDALEEKGINEGDLVRIYDIEFDFVR